MPDSRLYGDQEIRAILRRAAERQHLDPAPPQHREGLTLEELQQVAAEAGIEPAHVEAAIAEIERTPPEARGVQVWGAPMHVEREGFIEGTVPDPAWEEMVAALQQAYNGPGEVRRIGRTREWSFAGSSGDGVLVSVAERDGGTRIRLSTSLTSRAVSSYAPALAIGFILSMVAVGTIESGLLASVAFVTILGVFYAAARAVFRYLAGFQRDKADDVMRRLEAIARQHRTPAEREAAAGSTATASAGPVALPEDAPPASETEPPVRSRTRSS
ncbi:MAG: hypothetical protein D6685_10715 [Bacteroidetes bacterium]|nr:MAG: hypothetical protein D6685_10715 [Bacteroidota bacterium]